MRKRGITYEDRVTALVAWARRRGNHAISDRHIEACEKCGVDAGSRFFPLAVLNAIEESKSDESKHRTKKKAT